MPRVITFLLLVIMTACTASPAVTPSPTPRPAATITPAPQPPLPSDWAGEMTHADGHRESILLKITETGGTLNFQPQTENLPLAGFERSGATVSFEAGDLGALQFSGSFDGSRITGEVEANGEAGSFTLLPLAAAANPALDQFFGTYQFDSGEALLINSAPEYSQAGLYFFGQGLMLTDFGTGAIRRLYPTAEDTFLVGRARALGAPFPGQVIFARDGAGKVIGLSWQSRDPLTGELGEAQDATRLALASEVVHFTSEDGTKLTGLLTLPPTPGPYPAIMNLHGSEPGTKDDFGSQQMSAFMASQGIAVLTYDKRGAGESGGHYSESASGTNLGLTAQDALSGVAYLKSRPEIIADRIGLSGFSQAGWVIPLAASQSDDVAYFIVLSGPVTSVGHESLYSSYTNNGDSPTQTSQGEIMRRLSTAPHSGFDPVPSLAELEQPGLWLWGDQDKSIPVPESEANLKGLMDQGRSNFAYAILADADHNLQQTTQGLFNEIPYSPGYHPDYYTSLASWLKEHAK